MLLEIFLVSFKLGCTSFGGPTAHLAYFQNEYVQNKKWLKAHEYSNLVALSQLLPGPASSQVGMSIGLLRGGMLGSIVSFIGFTLPSALFLMMFAYYYAHVEIGMGWIHGLKLVAVTIVAQAIWDMSKKLITSIRHLLIALLSMGVVLLWANPLTQVIVIVLAALIGFRFLKDVETKEDSQGDVLLLSKKAGASLLTIFFILLIGLPFVSSFFQNDWLVILEKFYVSGALVFGGGHVVLPLLEAQFVQSGYLSSADFLTGYGVTQVVPGPLFTFATYIGMFIGGIPGAIIATIAIFLPAFLLIMGVLPFWIALNHNQCLRGAIMGANLAVVGILAGAFIHPIVSQTIKSNFDMFIVVVFLSFLLKWKIKPFVLVLLGIGVGVVFY